jgi:hypothetical protein
MENPTMRKVAIIFGLIFFGMLGGAMTAAAENGSAAEEARTIGRTPPRLSFLDGQVSFWRPGAQDWAQAQINTALAPGDQLYIEGSGNLELQVGAQAYVRGGRDAQIGLETQEPDFLRFKVTGGRVAFDLRTLAPGHTVEVDTPHGAFIMNHEGYFRVDVGDERTTFTTRRAGRASVVAAAGDAVPMEPDESAVIEGPSEKGLAFQAAPAMDAWDTWNYDRTDALLEAGSSRYVTPDTYGTADLDRYGSWRVLPTYGRVWVPAGVAPGWAPYSTGSWMYDSYYGWTWVDTAPWGWAPYHYGRWVHVNSYWCWAPGPVVRHAVYAPALVAFFGGPGVSVGLSVGGPGVGWVALGWGEPLIPWWGRPGFIHRPWWGGWGGPRCINGRVIHRRTVVTINAIHHYHNRRIRNALIVVDKGRFGHGRIHHRPFRNAAAKDWRPLHRAPNVRPGAASFAPSARHGRRPPEKILRRHTVTLGPQHARRPSATRRSEKVRRRTNRSQPYRSHERSRSGERPKTFGPSTPGHSQARSERPPAAMGPGKVRREPIRTPRRAPAINPKKPTRHVSPRTSKPAAGIKPQRRFNGTSGTRRATTFKDPRSRSIENPTRFRHPPQRNARRNAAPAHRSPTDHQRAGTRGRIANKPVDSQPSVRGAKPRPRRPEAIRPAPNKSGRHTNGGFRSSPRAAEPRQSHYGDRKGDSRRRSSDRWQPQNNRGAGAGSGHRFQRRRRD